MKKRTLSELAQLTGYSMPTISRVLNGKGTEYRISQETQEHIMRVAKEQNYSPNVVAQSLRNHTSNMIGLIVPQISNPFFANLASSIIAEAKKYDMSIMLIDTLDDIYLESQAIVNMVKRNIDGIILVPCGDNIEELKNHVQATPLILVDRYYKSGKLPYISSNNYEGGYMAMRQLLLAGHRNILCIKGTPVSISTQERERGCKAAVRDFGVKCNLYFKGNEFSIENGYVETRLAVTLNPKPTAIFAMSSTILLGVIQALKEQKLNVPEDISIISFDNNLYLDYLNPPISRIAQPLESIGRAAMKIMAVSIKEKLPITSQILMSPFLIERDSIKKIE